VITKRHGLQMTVECGCRETVFWHGRWYVRGATFLYRNIPTPDYRMVSGVMSGQQGMVYVGRLVRRKKNGITSSGELLHFWGIEEFFGSQ